MVVMGRLRTCNLSLNLWQDNKGLLQSVELALFLSCYSKISLYCPIPSYFSGGMVLSKGTLYNLAKKKISFNQTCVCGFFVFCCCFLFFLILLLCYNR